MLQPILFWAIQTNLTRTYTEKLTDISANLLCTKINSSHKKDLKACFRYIIITSQSWPIHSFSNTSKSILRWNSTFKATFQIGRNCFQGNLKKNQRKKSLWCPALDDSGGRVLAGELEAVRAHGVHSGQVSGVGNHVPRQGQGDVLVVPENRQAAHQSRSQCNI